MLDAKKRAAVQTVLIENERSDRIIWLADEFDSLNALVSRRVPTSGVLAKRVGPVSLDDIGICMKQVWQFLQASRSGSHFKFEEETDGEVHWFRMSWKRV